MADAASPVTLSSLRRETGSSIKRARQKLLAKGADAIVLNDVSQPRHRLRLRPQRATFITRDHEIDIPRCPSARWPTASWTRSSRCGQPHRPSSRHPAGPAMMPDSCTRLQIQVALFAVQPLWSSASLPGTALFTAHADPAYAAAAASILRNSSGPRWPPSYLDGRTCSRSPRRQHTLQLNLVPNQLVVGERPSKVAHTVPLLITSVLLDPAPLHAS